MGDKGLYSFQTFLEVIKTTKITRLARRPPKKSTPTDDSFDGLEIKMIVKEVQKEKQLIRNLFSTFETIHYNSVPLEIDKKISIDY